MNSMPVQSLRSSTTTISCGIDFSFKVRCKCSTVDAMHSASSIAGMTTLSSESGSFDAFVVLMVGERGVLEK